MMSSQNYIQNDSTFPSKRNGEPEGCHGKKPIPILVVTVTGQGDNPSYIYRDIYCKPQPIGTPPQKGPIGFKMEYPKKRKHYLAKNLLEMMTLIEYCVYIYNIYI